jgi:hypothetical protein
MLQLEDPIWVIERGGYTRLNGEPDSGKLHLPILKHCTKIAQSCTQVAPGKVIFTYW